VRKKHDTTEQGAADDRAERLKEVWGLGVQGYYDTALEILEDLLEKAPTDVRSLRLKGNLLELKEMDRLEYSGKKLTTSVDYLAARSCYERILEIDPRNVKAHIDLGDHYRVLEANDKALGYYREAAKVLQKMPTGETWREEIQELLDRVALLKKHDRLAPEAGSIETWCRRALGATDS
jgi:tetratricopeptide (TPR) repeat protein